MAEIRLNQVIVGIGNVVHDQFHRTNRINLDAELVNKAMVERFNGGVTASTLAALGTTGGGLSADHSGMVNVEEGWNQRRGLCLLKMNLIENNLVQQDMSVMGYLVAGGNTFLGVVPDDVIFVPVRSWTITHQQRQDVNYLPTTGVAITESSQFLMPDADMMRDLQSVRPVDVVNYGMGYQYNLEEDNGVPFDGIIGTNLSKQGIIISKSANLDPTASAKSILSHAARVGANQVSHNTLSENFAQSMSKMRETELYEHPFLNMMMTSLGLSDFAGFYGFSFGELRQVFQGFDNVVLPPSDRGVAPINHMLTSSTMGSADFPEVISNELAFISMHSMVDTGLMFLEFTASNNATDLGVNRGEIYFNPGVPASMINNDPYASQRVDRFKDYIESTFFQKYGTKLWGQSTAVEVSVKMNLFGESEVDITLDRNYNAAQKFTYPGYCINRTNSNIATGDNQRQMAINNVDNIKQYFASEY